MRQEHKTVLFFRLLPSSVFLLVAVSSLAPGWVPGIQTRQATLSKDLTNVKRIWYLPENPAELGNIWGIMSQDHVKRMHEEHDARAINPRKNDDKIHFENDKSQEAECEDHFYDGMSEDVYCWII